MATASCRRVTGRVYTHYSRLITGLLLNSSGHGTSLAPPSVSRDFRTDLPDRRPWSSSMVPLDRYKMIIWGTSSSHIYASFASLHMKHPSRRNIMRLTNTVFRPWRETPRAALNFTLFFAIWIFGFCGAIRGKTSS